ncbi:N6 adenine-specific DNA methyltransferase, D12 class [cyanobacterium endosymbiont of Rhopalodia gibberula]|uniref:DNA adenine methylase n=1 Tax=cyanobacterium endosymbiont of Rhopalodia gibberula TaxID=1763363 RepID=UPI000DC6F3FA|nr:Dam family site-specific DNA-(adenine-N6)-methyltransferase [cyanobacterium endosymbiont of Rhopalodia gibberula]BBA78952.1 N6 adenine-specific DNA methyltransferase, D12 class [cyanobacterium endosymbiont of Rhopalodia gibberula]
MKYKKKICQIKQLQSFYNLENSKRLKAYPVLKWAGGKMKLLPQIQKQYPSKLQQGSLKTYIEPFVGGASVFFDVYYHFNIEKAYFFDKNTELIILYKVIKNNAELLIDRLSKIKEKYLNLTEEKRKNFYYQSRNDYNTFDKKVDTDIHQRNWVERAALTIFLNRTCFNGLYRVNRKGLFNVPMGKYKNPAILNSSNIRAVSQALKIVEIKQCDFSEVLKYANKNTFIYYDPPYRSISKTATFNAYSSLDFKDNEQRRLRDLFIEVSKKGSYQMLSNSDPTNYIEDFFFDELYCEFNIKRILASRMINSKGNSRGKIREILVTNYSDYINKI